MNMISRCLKYLVDKNKSIERSNRNAAIEDNRNSIFHQTSGWIDRIEFNPWGASREVKGDPPDGGSGVPKINEEELAKPFVETKETGHHNTNVGNCNSNEFSNHCGYTGYNDCNSGEGNRRNKRNGTSTGTCGYQPQSKIVIKPKESNAKLQKVIQEMQTKKENEVTTSMSIGNSNHESKKSLTCTREFGFDAAHRLVGHEDKCKFLHGHRYSLFVTMESTNGLDNVGRILDFSKIKEVIGNFIDDNLDHAYIANSIDILVDILEKYEMRVYLMTGNPTAENMVKMLYRELTDVLVNHNVRIINIKLYETPNCYAEFGYNYSSVNKNSDDYDYSDEY